MQVGPDGIGYGSLAVFGAEDEVNEVFDDGLGHGGVSVAAPFQGACFIARYPGRRPQGGLALGFLAARRWRAQKQRKLLGVPGSSPRMIFDCFILYERNNFGTPSFQAAPD